MARKLNPVSMSLSNELHERVKEYAERKGRTVSDLMRELLAREVDSEQTDEPTGPEAEPEATEPEPERLIIMPPEPVILTPEQRVVQRDIIQSEFCRRSLKAFIKVFWDQVEKVYPFVDGYHVDALVDHLTHLDEIKNLLICLPPRHSKSLIVDVFFFAWRWLMNPNHRFIYASYSQEMSEKHQVISRSLIQTELFQRYYGDIFKLSDVQNTKRRVENDKGGFRFATSPGGPSTGDGGEVIVFDDPVKVGDGKAKREASIQWYFTEFYNRLNNLGTGCRIVVGQRCSTHDLQGTIIQNDSPNHWTKLIIPLEFNRSKTTITKYWKDPRKNEGDLLCPDLLPRSKVEATRSTMMTKRQFEAQYNQDPRSEGGMFSENDFRYFTENETHYVAKDGAEYDKSSCYRLCSVDLAISERSRADYTVIAVADVHPATGSIFLIHLNRDKMSAPRTQEVLRQVYNYYQPERVLVEDAGYQRSVVQHLRNDDIPARWVKVPGDKVAKANPVEFALERHKLHFPEDRNWVGALEDELIDFPDGQHDDQVDSLSFICGEAQNRSRRYNSEEPTQEPTPDEYAEWERKTYLEMLNEGT